MIRKARRLAGEFLNVEVERWSECEQGWCALAVEEGVRVEGGVTVAAVRVLEGLAEVLLTGAMWRWAGAGEGSHRITVRRQFDNSLRLRREVEIC